MNSGKITDIKVTSEGATKSATVTFEKATASKTALLLNHTKLGDNEITVTGSGSPDSGNDSYKQQDDRDTDEITQEEKPRSRILAEYLAHGYVVADASLKKAIDLDDQHGVSSRFMNTLNGLDTKYHATDRAKTVDQSYGITQRASGLLSGLGSYFEKAANTPTGQKLVNFYSSGQRQVEDIHKTNNLVVTHTSRVNHRCRGDFLVSEKLRKKVNDEGKRNGTMVVVLNS